MPLTFVSLTDADDKVPPSTARHRTAEMKIQAPFSPNQVQILNERQCHVDGGVPFHPFTCPNRDEGVTYDADTPDYSQSTHGTGGDRGVLIATEQGWVCPHCDYRQDWAHAAMVEQPVPVGEVFKNFPTISAILSGISPSSMDKMIASYRDLAARGKPGAKVMLDCLQRRRTAIAQACACHS